ncbi:MAG: HEAT repeat domain-containing protein [Chthonomonadales bacterium]
MNVTERCNTVRKLRAAEDEKAALALLRFVADQSPTVRECAMSALRDVGGWLAAVAARALVTDPRPFVRSTAVATLAEVGSSVDLGRFIAAAQDPDWSVRTDAIPGLLRVGGHRTLAVLRSMVLRDPNPVVRRDAAIAISRHQMGPSLAQELVSALNRELSPIACVGLVYALYCLGDRARIEQLVEMLRHPDPLVRCNVVNSIEPPDIREEDRDYVVSAVRKLLAEDNHPGVIGDAKSLLARLTGPG